MGELAAYDQVKGLILSNTSLPDSTLCHFLSSVGSGLVSSVCSTPADVVKTRLMQSGTPYTGTIDCVTKTVRHEGLGALYKGFFPTWARLGPWQLVFWMTYEHARKTVGMSGF
eukprot:NODE_1277_length_1028_cov_74.054137_g979_i0.p2 GENE.NODE_1277_length_1028_cov_74.054137_g979_i0~~NODE_1277_length_1028_cov_74.054137_g979_i0.p2  ORF type:complete len:113 (-),score=14.19 NODE_1277_length_1028_cov_74.054137_g979_i0:105-443(-)